jgi:tetratricopeptide (TPR) repeat protein
VAAYSRQDEFEADRGAADLCGAAIMRSALIKVESLGNVAARLPWRERVARHHSAEGFSRWLVKELATDDSTQPPGDAPDPSNKYSTHPLLRDRLAALPLAVVSASGAVDRTGSGIDLLAAPDTVAAKLIAEIEKLVLDEEQKDRKQLKRWLQKARSARQMRPLQVFGVLLVLFGVVGGGGFWLFNHLSPGLAAFVLFFAGSGVLLHRKGRYREGLSLPVPDYSLLKRSWDEARETEDVREVQKRVESELTALVASERKARKKASILAARSFEALAQCDYLRAHVAGRMCRALDDKSVDGALGLAIAAAALHQGQQAASVLGLVQRSTGFSTPPSLWGGAWVFLLSGDWARAEALLEGAVEQAPGEPTLVTLLALCQSRRGKLQSAIVTARKACSPKPRNKEHAKLLIGLLLDAGYVAEAKARLLKLEPELRSDTDLIIAMVRLNVMQGNFDAAEEWTRLLKQVAAGANSLITVGEHYEVARRPDDAAVFYQQAMLLGHYPDALLGLARLEASRQNKDQARKHIFSAVDVKKPLGSKALGPIPLFHRIIVQLLALQDPVPGCRAWTATLTASTPEALINKTLLIYAAGTSEADGYLQSLLRAMQPGSPPVLPGTILWREARGEQQPEGSARPGIQCVLN